MSTPKWHEGASNCHTLFGPILCQMLHPKNVPYKVSIMFAPTFVKKLCRAHIITCENP